MAAEDAPLIPIKSASGVSPALQNTQAFLDMITGKSSSSSSSGETKTTQTDVSSEGIAELIRQIMEGTGGLADVATGSHVAGLYDDSTKTLLVQNLLAKVAGQAALASAKTTTTTSPQTTTNKTNPQLTGTNAAAGLLVAAGTSIGGKLAKKYGLDKVLGLDDSASVAAPASAGSAVTSIQNISDTSPAGIANDTASDLGTMGGSFGAQADNVASIPLQGTDTLDTSTSFVNDDSLGEAGVGDFITGATADEGMDLASSVASAGSDIGNALDWLPFKNGGRVGMPVKGYASGGLVNEDRGTPTPVTGATPEDSGAAVHTLANPMILPVTPASGKKGGSGDTGNGEGGGGNPSANTLQTADAPFSLSQFGQIALGVLGMMSNPVFGIANFATQMGTGKGIMSNVVDKGINLFNTISPSKPVSPVAVAATTPATPATPAATSSPSDMIPDSSSQNTDPAPPTDPIESMINNSVDSYDLDSGELVGSTLGTSDAVGGTDASSSDSGGTEVGIGGDGAEPGAPGFAVGGQISAPGDGSEDTRIIKAADDEFVLNSNAARAIGYDKLNWLNTVLGGFQGAK